MKRSILIFVSLTVISLGISFPAQAVSDPSESSSPMPSSWQSKIEDIKKKAQALLDQHDRLTEENASLEKEIVDLEHNDIPSEDAILDQQAQEAKDLRFWRSKVESLESDNRILSKELIVLKQKEHLRRLQLEDLEYQERQLMLGNKLTSGQTLRAQSKKAQSTPLFGAGLAKDLPKPDPEKIQSNIQQTQKKYEDLEKQKQSLTKEIKSLKDKNAAGVVSVEQEYAQKKKIKRSLEAKIADLEKRKALSSSQKTSRPVVAESKMTAPALQDVVFEMNLLQTRNKELRQQAENLSQNISSLKKEVTQMEAGAKKNSKKSGKK